VKLISFEIAMHDLVYLGVVQNSTDRDYSSVVHRIAFNYDVFLHFELIASILTITQAMESGGLNNPSTDSVLN
jgi:hypothetical protein